MMNRRDILLAGSAGIVGGLATPAITQAVVAKSQDPRVILFIDFLNAYKATPDSVFPGKAYFQQYVSDDFSYVTTAGKRLAVDELISRAKLYADSFGTANANLKSAVMVSDGAWLIKTLTPFTFAKEFRGFPASKRSADIEAIWEVSFDANGKISSMRRHGDYSALAAVVGTNDLCRLHQLD